MSGGAIGIDIAFRKVVRASAGETEDTPSKPEMVLVAAQRCRARESSRDMYQVDRICARMSVSPSQYLTLSDTHCIHDCGPVCLNSMASTACVGSSGPWAEKCIALKIGPSSGRLG
jgi:hypothetical protein